MPLGHQRCCHGVQIWSTGRGAVASMHIMLAVFSRSLLFLNAERRVLVFFGVWGWGCVCLTLLCDRNRSWWLLEVSNRSGHSWRLAISFRVASIALHDILTCFIMCWCRSVWAAQYFGEVFGRWLAFFVAGAALWTCPFSFSVPGAALSTCGVACFFANRIVCVKWWQCAHCMWDMVRVVFCVAGASSGEDPSCVDCRSIWDTLDFTLDTPHSTLYTPRYTWHSTLYTPHSTLFTFHSIFYTPHSTLYTLHFTLYTWHSTLYTPHSILFTFHSTFYTPHSTLYTLQVTLYTPHSIPYTPHLHVTLYTLHSTLFTSHSTLDTLHFTLCTLHSTLCTVHSTLDTPHSSLYMSHSTLHSAFHSQHSTLFIVFTFHTLHSTPFHSLHWYGNRGKKVQDCWFFVSHTCFTWLHSGSLVLFFFETVCLFAGEKMIKLLCLNVEHPKFQWLIMFLHVPYRTYHFWGILLGNAEVLTGWVQTHTAKGGSCRSRYKTGRSRCGRCRNTGSGWTSHDFRRGLCEIGGAENCEYQFCKLLCFSRYLSSN